MKVCKKCGKSVPSTAVIDGKWRNLCHRKFCFTCSPFGEHNTRNLVSVEKDNRILIHTRVCVECGREYKSKHKKGAKCFSCYFKTKKDKRSNEVYGIVGESCWICGYNKGKIGRRILQFHHMPNTNKKFQLDTRSLVGMRWDRIIVEMKKCALLCCRCHAEVHAGIINEEEVSEVFKREWEKHS